MPRSAPGRIIPLLVLVAALSGVAPSPAAAVDATWVRKWRADLDTVRVAVPRVHANAFHTITRSEWNAAIDRLEQRLPTLDQHEITIALAAIIARIGDGHTRLTLPVDPGFGAAITHTPTAEPKDPALRLHYLPIRMYRYADGLHVREIDADHARFAGAKVLRIGGMSADSAMAAVAPTIQRDNEQQIASRMPVHLMIPELLHAVGVTPEPDRASFELELPSGAGRTVTLGAVPNGQTAHWVAVGGGATPPLFRRNPDEPFWTAELPDQDALYVRVNEIEDTGRESFAAFADRLFDRFDAGPATRMVLDLRGNPGGDFSRTRQWIHRAICSAKLKEPGSFFVVTDRGTFSAAMMFAAELEKHTPAVFAGEATGARPNGYGDSRKVVLPNTGLTVRVSTLYWQMSDPRDDRAAIAPLLPVPLTSRDDAASRDPVLETLERFWSMPDSLTGSWSGTASVGYQAFPIALEFEGPGPKAKGRVTAEALEMDRVPLEDVAIASRIVTFVLRTPYGPVPVRAWIGGGTLVGSGSLAGEDLLIALRRAR